MADYKLAYLQATHDFSSLPFKYTQLNQLVKLTPFLSGERCQLLFSNRYGKSDLVFDSVRVADNPAMTNASAVTFQGQWSLSLKRGCHLFSSDAVEFPVHAGQPLYVQMIASRKQAYADFTCSYATGWVNAAISRRVNFRPQLPDNWHARHGWVCLDGLNVLTDRSPEYLELTGDSLAETGMVAQELFSQLLKAYPEQLVAINTGISGNRLLHDAPQDGPLFATYGNSLLHRLKDETRNPDLRVALIGSNDLLLPMYSQEAHTQNAELIDMCQGFMKLSQIGSLITTTIAPFRLFDGPRTDAEKQVNRLRQNLNRCLSAHPFVVNTAPLVANQSDSALATQMDFGDGMHLSPRGGAAVADALMPAIKQTLI